MVNSIRERVLLDAAADALLEAQWQTARGASGPSSESDPAAVTDFISELERNKRAVELRLAELRSKRRRLAESLAKTGGA